MIGVRWRSLVSRTVRLGTPLAVIGQADHSGGGVSFLSVMRAALRREAAK